MPLWRSDGAIPSAAAAALSDRLDAEPDEAVRAELMTALATLAVR